MQYSAAAHSTSSAVLHHHVMCRGGGGDSWSRRTSFLGRGYRRRGGGGTKKFARNFFPQFFSGPEKPEISSTLPHLFGFGRVFFKVTIDVSADMGGICVSQHKDPQLQCSAHPKGTNQSTKKQQKPEIKNFHCVAHPTCKHRYCLPWGWNQKPSRRKGTVYPLVYGPSLTDVCTGMALVFGPIWFSSIIEFS